MINKSILVGRLTRDPEVRKTQTGKSVVNFSIACTEGYGDKKRTDFPNCQAWDGRADFIGNYLKKGSLVGIVGRTQTRSYENSDGRKVHVQEILVDEIKALESMQSSNQNQTAEAYGYQPGGNSSASSFNQMQEDGGPILDITNDDLPF